MTTIPDRDLALEIVRATESGALAASRMVGRGDKIAADQAAVDGMRALFDTVSMDGIVVIGEGEKDEAPMLYNGERVGDGSGPEVDVAVDPLEGTTLAAKGMPNALTVVAISARGSMFDPGPCVYMEKLVGGPDLVGALSLDGSDRRRAVLGREAPRGDARRPHGGRARPSAARADDHAHPRGRRAHPADLRRRRLGRTAGGHAGHRHRPALGHRGHARGSAFRRCHPLRRGHDPRPPVAARRRRGGGRARAAGYEVDRVLTTEDLVASEDCFFAATGVTDGDLVRGVRFDATGATTQSLVMRARSGTIRRVDAHHHRAKLRLLMGDRYG